MFNSDTFANRPAFGIVGRIFISTDTKEFFRDTGTSWELIGGPGSGTVTGSGTIGTLPIWTSSSALGNSTLLEGATKFTTTKDFQADGYYLTGMTGGSGALYWTSDRVTLANYNVGGIVHIEVNGGSAAQIIAADLSTTFYGGIIRNGGLSTQFLKADGSLDSNTYNTGSGAASQVAFFSGTNAITGENNLWWDAVNNHFGINTNTPGTALDIHHDQNTILQLNQTTATNDTRIAFQNSGTALWRIGNFYTAGANDFGVFDVVSATQQFTILKTTGQTFIGAKTTASGRLVVNSATADNHLQIVGANAPSIRIDNAGSGGTQRFVFGLATATNNFIQGATAGEFCISTQSAGNMLFGMWQTTNASEVMRITTTNNLLVGSSIDNGSKLQITGAATISTSVTAASFNGTTNNIFSVSGSEKMRLDTGGNLGLGVTPSSWSASFRALQIGSRTAVFTESDLASVISNNYVFTDTRRYIASDFATNYAQVFGEHRWLTAPSGIAGNVITFTQAMTLTANGRLLLGTTTEGSERLQVNGDGSFKVASGNVGYSFVSGSDVFSFYFNDADNSYRIYSGIGTPGDRFILASNGVATFSSSIEIGNSVAAAVAAPSTHKVAILIGGVQYYLLASNV